MAALLAPAQTHALVHRQTIVAETKAETRARHKREWRERVTPFKGGNGKWYATPWVIPLCESGADPHIGYAGLYGLISPTWAAYGGLRFASTAGDASKREQDLVAHKLWEDAGESAWAPFETACAYR